MQNRVKLFFEEMSVKSDYEILDYGKNKNEMEEIAKKRGLKIPSKDIAMFKCKYAMVNQTNLNGCVLPKEEVEKSLETLNLKAIDKDHLRQSAVGMWLDSKLVGDDIVAYGGFWKSNFPEEYEEIKNRMKEGKMKISFEAWGDREFNKDGSYNLKNIEFAGGALLFDTEPAFPNAEVMTFSNRTLEFAKVIEDTKLIKGCGDIASPAVSLKLIKKITEETYSTVEIPNDKGYDVEFKRHTKKISYFSDGSESVEESDSISTDRYTSAQIEDIINEEIDVFFSSIIEGEDLVDETMSIEKMEVLMNDMSDEVAKKKMMVKIDELKKKKEQCKKLDYKERQSLSDNDFAIVANVENKKTGKPRKIRMFPIKDPVNIANALVRLPQAIETLKKLDISIDTVKNKILKKARELNMTDLLKSHEEEANTLMDELLKKYSKASIEEMAKFLDVELETIKASIVTKDQELAAKVQEITTKDTELATLKTEKETILKTIEESKLIVENSKIELEKVKAELAVFQAERDKKLNEEKAVFIKSRKDEIGEYAKDMSDEDILNELKFENAKLKKERDEAVKKASEHKGLDAGAVIITEDSTTKTRKVVQEKAWQTK
uniref:Uncharacterized protein n=1 Tax=viral metagenome TaxID=1070528 RepID=A0A6M3JNZ2_9ZZZZ